MENAMRSCLTICGAIILAWIASSPASAHSFMKKPFQKRYSLKLVSCNACHVKGEEKDVVNDFGETIQKLLEGTDIEARARVCKELDKEAKQKIEKELAEEFAVTLKRLDDVKAPNGKPYGLAIRDGEVDGAKPRKARAGASQEEEKDQAEEEEQEEEE